MCCVNVCAVRIESKVVKVSQTEVLGQWCRGIVRVEPIDRVRRGRSSQSGTNAIEFERKLEKADAAYPYPVTLTFIYAPYKASSGSAKSKVMCHSYHCDISWNCGGVYLADLV